MFTIRTLTPPDLASVRRLKDQAGWNQTDADLARFLRLADEGWLVAEEEGQVVGTVAAFRFGPVGWIAMMLVDEQCRGRGFGKALMQHSLDRFDAQGVRSVRLDATPLGRPLYEKLGFVAQFELTRYGGRARASDAAPAALPYAAEHWEPLLALDRDVAQTDRRPLLAALLAGNESSARVAVRNGEFLGAVIHRPGSTAAFIGPCLARSAEAGASLLSHALAEHAGRQVLIDVPRDNGPACRLAEIAGLVPQRTLTRMTRGPRVTERLESLWASSGPEKG